MNKLVLILFTAFNGLFVFSQVPYGANPEAGHYVQSGDAKIYYEIYGEGQPLLLLHGGYYGYISEFHEYLPRLIENFKVIAVATRGHGKSEIGHTQMSYHLWAKDAYAVIQQEGIDSAIVMGFSDGAISGAVFAHDYPEHTKRLVFMGGGLNAHHSDLSGLNYSFGMSGEEELKHLPGFLKERMKIMPEPERFAEWVDMLKAAWLSPVVLTNEEASNIQCPVLIVLGDRDDYISVEGATDCYRLIPNSELLIWPNSNHVSLLFNTPMFETVILPFLKE